MNERSKQILTNAKILIIREFPFMSYLVMKTRYIENNNLPYKTMAATIHGNELTLKL